MRKPAVNIATSAARAGGRELMKLLDRIDPRAVVEKGKNDFVSEADHRSEQAILDIIRRHHPEHAILSEESGALGQADYQWVIDPLDGTTNFVNGVPHFSVSIALTYQGRVEHGVVYDPVREELFATSRGDGAYLNDRRIRVRQRSRLEGSLLATGFPFRLRADLDQYSAVFNQMFLKASDIRRMGSAALDLAYVAAGRFDGFWEAGLGAWDIAAGSLLVAEAGGMVMDYSGHSDSMLNGECIAAHVKVATEMHRVVAQTRAT